MGISTFPPASSGGGGGPSLRIDRITSTTTWTAPSDVTEVDVALAGGGGSGANWSNLPNSGGGGSLELERLTVVPGTAYTITIGAGGARVNGQQAGNNGTASSFGNLLTADGGPGGPANATVANNTGYGGYPTYEVNNQSNSVSTLSRIVPRVAGRQLGGTIFEGYPIGGSGGSNFSAAYVLMGGPGSTGPDAKDGNPNTGAGGIGSYNQNANFSGAGGSGVCIIRYWSAV